ncbi:3beta-hydroxysteroid-4alpha-carboxylate 3-dehydrogenas(decarboxylating) [Malassezia japonica]|uniref:3beta-hydroxysteroid-4alpha-carboxylate 3-dehydrogenas(Decarboxylating) n=1 Tax=Malassezia japonica TaxID=223818 RepID=A0AAF0F3Q0_9BASI|nr:3beta-hydroxysteroid-4alpha-carboxylate 3-dehydrogenas(decarboxylating) [Malassezia japonica]WFD37807.1 3beta-hydroxysteroid-4alpha-carboxylate 3-dehydrogenas(decarboxylating) [Malassezia japonica]
MSRSAPTQELHFVIGGVGFLGTHIVNALVKRGEKAVAVFDLREPEERTPGVQYYDGDLTSRASLTRAIANAQEDIGGEKRSVVVYHTASPVAGLGAAVYEKVNVKGTETVLHVCKDAANNVAKLIFTSSAGVVFTGRDLNYVDERLQYPLVPMDAYNDTKARAEQAVLAANDPEGLQTVALRPAGIFGPGDRQALPGFFNVVESGRTKFQIGKNQNLFDWTYVENVAHAHLLASDCLGVRGGPNARPAKEYDSALLLSEHLSHRALGEEEVGLYRDVPVSLERQDVPAPATDFARAHQPRIKDRTGLDERVVFRNRFDPLFHHASPGLPSGGNPRPKVHSLAKPRLGAGGEAFFITNGQPVAFWDFPRALWYRYNGTVVTKDNAFVLGLQFALIIAFLAECYSWITGRPVQFTRYRVTYTACARYYNIEKARRILGYEPLIGMEEAIDRSVAWWKKDHPVEQRANESAKTK